MKNKAILINVVERTVTEIFVDGLDDMYAAMNVDLVTIATGIDDVNDIFVDDEGLLKGPEHFFFYEGAHQPFAGNGLVLGKDEEGESISTTLTLEEVTSKVQFLNRSEALRKAKEIEKNLIAGNGLN